MAPPPRGQSQPPHLDPAQRHHVIFVSPSIVSFGLKKRCTVCILPLVTTSEEARSTMMNMDMSGSRSGVPWLDQPVMLHSSRANACKMTPEQCAYRNERWRYWYVVYMGGGCG